VLAAVKAISCSESEGKEGKYIRNEKKEVWEENEKL